MQHKRVSWSAKGPGANQSNEILRDVRTCKRVCLRLIVCSCVSCDVMRVNGALYEGETVDYCPHFLQLEPSDCWNIWLFFFHPQRPLMCAASSCVSMGREPIRSQLGLLIIWPSTAKHCALWCEWHDHFAISGWWWWMEQRVGFLLSLCTRCIHHVWSGYLGSICSDSAWAFLHVCKVGLYMHISTPTYCTLISAWDVPYTISIGNVNEPHGCCNNLLAWLRD